MLLPLCLVLCFSFISQLLLGQGSQSTPFVVSLTEAEKDWLKAHPDLVLGLDPAWPPFSFEGSDGSLQGIDLDYIRQFEQALGVKFKTSGNSFWEATEKQIAEGKIDVVCGISPNPERARHLNFTTRYIDYPTAIITRLDGPFLTDPNNIDHLHVAAPRAHITTLFLRDNYEGLVIKETKTSLEALQLVSNGNAGFAFENLATVSYLIRENGLTNLKISGVGDHRFELHMGVKRDLPLLHSAIQKCIDAVTEQQKAMILSRWIHLETEPVNPLKKYLKWIIAGAIFVLLGYLTFWYRNRHLRKELTERKRIETELRKLNDDKIKLMNMAVHDVNNPLTLIVMNCELALGEQGKLPEESTPIFNDILKHSLRISHLIRSLLEPDVADQLQHRLRPRLMSLSGSVKKVLASYEHTSSRKDITLSYDPPTGATDIWADPDAVLQVLENLLSNAVKFSPSSSAVTISLEMAEHHARLAVRDSGPGISKQDRPKLFGEFSRLSATPTGGEPTHGLGLFIVKQLVDEMKGRVSVESREGEGATFIVEFPTSGAG